MDDTDSRKLALDFSSCVSMQYDLFIDLSIIKGLHWDLDLTSRFGSNRAENHRLIVLTKSNLAIDYSL